MKNILLAVFAISSLFSLSTEASLVSVEGTFTSFSSWTYDPSDVSLTSIFKPTVNSVPLTVSNTSTPVGTNSSLGKNYYASDSISFSGSTTKVDFIYHPDPALNHPANSFEFIPNAAGIDVLAGETFQLGSFRFTNGNWFPQAELGFRLTTHSSDALLNGHIFEGTLRLVSNADTTAPFDPYEEADFFYVVERSDLGSVRVFDKFRQPPGNPGWLGEVALNGKIGSLIPTGFDALNSAAFTHPSVQPGPLSSVPVPASVWLFGSALGGLGLTRKRQSSRKLA